MRSFLCSVSVLTLITLTGCAASSSGSSEENGDAPPPTSEANLTSLPASGTFKLVDRFSPSTGSYVAQIVLSPNKHFAIDFVIRSSVTEPGSWFPVTHERTFVQRGETYNIFVDEGRRILAFHVIHEDESTGVAVYELKSASASSIKLSAVGGTDAFELRRETSP